MNQITETILNLARGLVQNPDAVRIDEHVDHGLTIQLSASREDQPRIVGKHGATIKALKAIAADMGRQDAPVELILLEPSNSPEAHHNGKCQGEQALLADILRDIESVQPAKIEQSGDASSRSVHYTIRSNNVPESATAIGLILHAIGRRRDTKISIAWAAP